MCSGKGGAPRKKCQEYDKKLLAGLGAFPQKTKRPTATAEAAHRVTSPAALPGLQLTGHWRSACMKALAWRMPGASDRRCPCVAGLSRAVAERDHAGGGEPLDLLAREPELAQDLGGVLAEKRRRAVDPGRRPRGASGKAEESHAPLPGLIHRRHELEVAHLRILEDLVELVDRARRDARRLQPRDPLAGGGRR